MVDNKITRTLAALTLARPLLRITKLCKAFGAIVASDGISLDVRDCETHAVIGPNGAGKTTLIGQLAGEIQPDAGEIKFLDQNITRWPVHRRSTLGLARSFQITSLFPNFSALDNVTLAVQAHKGHSFHFWRRAGLDESLRHPAHQVLKVVGLAERAEIPAAQLAHGEQRQLEIAMALATRPSLLLLDEPTAGMGHEESASMVALLKRLKGKISILLVEHDMDAVFALADRITVLVYGKVIATGTPDEIRANEKVRRAYLGEEDSL